MLKHRIAQWVHGTRFETPIRHLYHAITGQSRTPETASDLYDTQAAAVIQRVLSRRSNCVDVGCHSGAILDHILRLAPEGDHYAFEPLPDFYSALVRRYWCSPNVHLYQAALSNEPGRVSFQHVVTNPAYSGLRKRRYDRSDEQVKQIVVDALRLDEIIAPGNEIRFIKIDVEGAELQVLEGSIATLRRCRPYVVFEHGLGAADMYGTHPGQVFDLFASCGLQLSLMLDWLDSEGHKRLTREAFADEFYTGRNYYFLAHPR